MVRFRVKVEGFWEVGGCGAAGSVFSVYTVIANTREKALEFALKVQRGEVVLFDVPKTGLDVEEWEAAHQRPEDVAVS